MLKDVAGSGNVELDTTLTQEGKAADAKAVGDAISKLSGGNPDWNAAEGDPGHVLNRTHWTEDDRVELLPKTTLSTNDEGFAEIAEPFELIPGDTYTVTWNGNEYQCTCVEDDGTRILVNDEANMDTGEGLDFAIIQGDALTYIFSMTPGDVTLSIDHGGETVHKLDNKYLNLDWLPVLVVDEILSERTVKTSTFQGLHYGAMGEIPDTVGLYDVLEVGSTVTLYVNGVGYKATVCHNLDGCHIVEFGFVNDPTTSASLPLIDGKWLVSITSSTANAFLFTYTPGTYTVSLGSAAGNKNRIPEEFLPDNIGGINITGASIGQIARISAVDAEGKPTEWEPIDLPDSGGNVDQTSPEYFGAVGDGVTDDSAAITQALAASKNVVFDGNKTYAVGSTIVIPRDSMVDFRGATVVPTGNHDVIQVKPGSCIENLVVRCTGVTGWDSAAVVLYGGDKFLGYNQTTIKNVKLYNNTSSTAGLTTQGIGFKLYGNQFGDYIEGIAVEEVSTRGFGIGMLFEGVPDDMENPTGGLVFIGANKFRGYWSYYDNRGIVMQNTFPNTHITNNIFTDLQIEPKNVPKKEKQSSYGIYCNGFQNYFDGCLYDFFHNHTAVYFGPGSSRNIVKTTSSPNYDIKNPVRYVDLGINNMVTTYNRENADFVPYMATTPRMDGNQDDWLAFIDRRANCTLESFDGEPVSGSLANVFDPTPYKTLVYKTINPDVNNRRAKITINCNIAIKRLSNFYMQFYSAPKSIKVTFYNNKDATVVYDTDNNVNEIVGICSFPKFAESYEYNVAKIVIELGGFNGIETKGAETYGIWELVRIMAVDSYRTGNVWMRRDGGEMYGDIKFTQDKGVVLTSASGNKFLLTVSDDGTLSTSAYTEEQEEAPEVAVLTPTLLPGASWYNVESSGIAQSEITSVVFDSTYVSTGEEDASWACDEDINGNIMAYRNGTEVVIKSTTGSEGVKLNPDSTYMFANDGTNANFSSLASITGTETLKADKNTTVAYICTKNSLITSPIAIPEGVTDMSNAFARCTALTEAPELPNGVVSLNNAFTVCSSLQSLPELPASVTNINYAFHQCTAATKAPSTIPAKVSTMTYAFRNCVLLTGTITVNATGNNYSNCFENTGRDTENGIVLTGSSPYLTELAATAGANGKVTVAT